MGVGRLYISRESDASPSQPKTTTKDAIKPSNSKPPATQQNNNKNKDNNDNKNIRTKKDEKKGQKVCL